MREYDWEGMGGRIQPPALDAITEKPIEQGERVVDTLYNTDLPIQHYMNGRRFLREETLREAALALGYRLQRIPEHQRVGA